MSCLFGHKWGAYTDPVDTGNHIYAAQFRSCNRCNKIQVSYIKMSPAVGSASVKAKAINESFIAKHNTTDWADGL